MADQDDHAFVIGIDFGTTYSGAAWCYAGEPNNIEVVTTWPMRSTAASDTSKVPSKIHYNPAKNPVGWGYNISPEVESLTWFKLLLVDENDLPQEYQGSEHVLKVRKQAAAMKYNAVKIIADYLRFLWLHVIRSMERTVGEESVTGAPFRVCITVPAIWSERAKRRMRQAVKDSGIQADRDAGPTTVDLVAEPEAAALATMNDFHVQRSLKVGDALVVCDAGGGTVDLISFEVLSVKPVAIKHCVKGDGRLCGATFVDQAFKDTLEAAVGKARWAKLSQEDIASMMEKDWENGIKRIFDDGDADRTWPVTVPHSAWEGKRAFGKVKHSDDRGDVPLESGRLKFERGHIRDVFEDTFSNIRTLVDKQVSGVEKKLNGSKPKALLLVGGFGSSGYLYQNLTTAFRNRGLAIMQSQGPRPWTAVCRGAVLHGLSQRADSATQTPAVVSRIARRNYGMRYYGHYDKDRHSADEREWHDLEERWVVHNIMEWYIRKGDELGQQGRGAVITHPWSKIFRAKPSKLTLDIYENDDDDPPARYKTSVRWHKTIQFKTREEYEDWPERTNTAGLTFRRMYYDLQMSSTSTSIDWKILVDGEVQGEESTSLSDEMNRLGI